VGKRETLNTTRIFISEENRACHPACGALAEAFLDKATVALLQDVCGGRLAGSLLHIESGSSLHIEHCQDTDGFWRKPHTNIGARLYTMLIHLSDHPDAEQWGTDVLDARYHLVERSSGARGGVTRVHTASHRTAAGRKTMPRPQGQTPGSS